MSINGIQVLVCSHYRKNHPNKNSKNCGINPSIEHNNHYHKHQRNNNKKINGFTLTELLVAISILSIITMTGTPSLSGIINNVSVRTTSYELSTTLRLARNDSTTNSTHVNLCALSNTSQNPECSSHTNFNSSWSNGWLVYADHNDNNTFDENDILINHTQNTGNVSIVFNQRGRLRFFPDGSSRSAGFYLCKQSGAQSRHIRLLYSGRSRTTKTITEKQQSICELNG